ncbi:TRAP-type mannitol/chloroaromatic compound transport system, small permease component [Poseidonocella pacifica]|uniref:TRAP transporter small permease protein n=1 Tax=Poseidonocella pacifica TaxID=871651 RepID=A0A1I0X6F0_9RHOB|nr:TRAP transporter small permease subunit [Poseidonocella pacifica]SFA95950.1 TRAP-type mannitol/chloroaromatic compound transport system, small permease component [Poseidonocella pacifica]
MQRALAFADGIDSITRAAGKIAAALLLVLVALIFFNVFGRYVIGGSPIWAQELEWHVMAPVALLGITVLMLENGHVRVDMLYDKLPKRAQHLLDLISMLLGVVIALLFIKYSSGFVDSAWSIKEGSPDPGGLPARYVVKAMIPAAFLLLAMQCAANAIRHAAALRGEA